MGPSRAVYVVDSTLRGRNRTHPPCMLIVVDRVLRGAVLIGSLHGIALLAFVLPIFGRYIAMCSTLRALGCVLSVKGSLYRAIICSLICYDDGDDLLSRDGYTDKG